MSIRLGMCPLILYFFLGTFTGGSWFAVAENAEIPLFLQRMHAAQQSMSRLRGSNGPVRSICYGELGCFNTSGPMKHVTFLPQSPEKIDTQFLAYQRKSPSKSHDLSWNKLTKSSKKAVDIRKNTIFVIHGFTESSLDPQQQELKNAILGGTDREVGTVVMVNWAKGAVMLSTMAGTLFANWNVLIGYPPTLNDDYKIAAVNTQLVGRQVALLVEKMRRQWGVNPARVHLIGFSLGAQVAGFAGKYSQAKFGWAFGRITGLDAAWPLFEGYPGSHLIKTDALFVDAIHTSAGHRIQHGDCGFTRPYAMVDFYPHNGADQPMCRSAWLAPIKACNHHASVQYYIASLKAEKCKLAGFKEKGRNDTVLGHYSAKYRQALGKRLVFPKEKFPYCG